MKYSRPGMVVQTQQILDYTTTKAVQEPLVNTDPLIEHKIIERAKGRAKIDAAAVAAKNSFMNVLSAEEQAVYDSISAGPTDAPLVDAGGIKV